MYSEKNSNTDSDELSEWLREIFLRQEAEKIVNAIINWKKQGIAILNSSPLSPTDELSDRILIDGASLHHNVTILLHQFWKRYR